MKDLKNLLPLISGMKPSVLHAQIMLVNPFTVCLKNQVHTELCAQQGAWLHSIPAYKSFRAHYIQLCNSVSDVLKRSEQKVQNMT
jgi:hypothetical protein